MVGAPVELAFASSSVGAQDGQLNHAVTRVLPLRERAKSYLFSRSLLPRPARGRREAVTVVHEPVTAFV
jgi:hypothetical protein